ncbi:MAG: TonB-dependent receptor, partial [Planctomycetota bacterium]
QLSRIAPQPGSLGLRWEQEGSWWAEGFGTNTRPQKRLSYGDSRDTERVPPGGTPGYNLYTVRGGWNILENLELSLAVENITNKVYRVHGSGTAEPGRNVVAAIDCRF